MKNNEMKRKWKEEIISVIISEKNQNNIMKKK